MLSKSFKPLKMACAIASSLLVVACSGFFDKDNIPEPNPLVQFTPETSPHFLWSAHTGNGPGNEYLKMKPALNSQAIYIASTNGVVTAVDKNNGRKLWQTNALFNVSVGPGANETTVVLGSNKGIIEALDAETGRIRWRNKVDGQILAQPAVGPNAVIIKTIDGYVHAFALQDGHRIWIFQQTEPNLILHSASAPIIQDRHAFIGFANGNLVNLSTNDGEMLWSQTVAMPQGAFAIERMVDIDANPIVYQHRIYAATYQGKIASLDWQSGTILWSHDLSSYTGLAADDDTVYVSDAKSFLWAFGAKSGKTLWQQNKLYARVVSGPAVLGNYVVVGDAEGYVHWLNKRDGHFAARIKIGHAVYASPVVDADTVYILTSNGTLYAYSNKLSR